MARFLALTLLGGAFTFLTALQADTPMAPMNPAPAPGAPAPVNTPSNKSANAAPVPVPPQMPDTFNRYGKILAPSDDVAHPIKLNVQFPGVGEMKIPSQDELNVRSKLEQLATLSDADIRAQLDLWPPYAKMRLGDEGQMLARIQQFKDQRSHVAQQKAHDLGLTLTPDQQAKFEKDYWDKRLQMDHDLAKQFEPIFKARQQKMSEELFREFSTPGGSVPPPPAPKPAPPPAVAQSKPMGGPASTDPAVATPMH